MSDSKPLRCPAGELETALERAEREAWSGEPLESADAAAPSARGSGRGPVGGAGAPAAAGSSGDGAGSRKSRSKTPEALRSTEETRGGAAGDHKRDRQGRGGAPQALRSADDVRGDGDGMAFAHPEQEAARKEAAAREGVWQAAMRARRGGGDALAGQER